MLSDVSLSILEVWVGKCDGSVGANESGCYSVSWLVAKCESLSHGIITHSDFTNQVNDKNELRTNVEILENSVTSFVHLVSLSSLCSLIKVLITESGIVRDR